ncbi:unnamed protein product, partial [Rotaria sordida]
LLLRSNNQPYLIALIDSISIYFDTIQNPIELTYQFSSDDTRDLLHFIIFISKIIYINIFQKILLLVEKTILSIFEYLYQRHGLILSNKQRKIYYYNHI